MRPKGGERQTLLVLTAILAGIVAVVGVDLATDYRQGVTVVHLVSEGLIAGLALGGAALLGRRLLELRAEAADLERQLEASREDAERWRREAREALEGLGEAIDRQFDRWELTPAEREVALFLLKGFSHREIAAYRDVSERTVRQQAHAVYSKADLSGRAELSAFFLEDLLLPSLDERSSNEEPPN